MFLCTLCFKSIKIYGIFCHILRVKVMFDYCFEINKKKNNFLYLLRNTN
jgi:hypothetical protein